MTLLVHAVTHSQLPPFRMPDRFRTDISHFATPAGTGDAPQKLGDNEFWISADDAEKLYDDGVFRIVSILDNENRTELELSEEQEALLEWLLEHKIRHVRLEQLKN